MDSACVLVIVSFWLKFVQIGRYGPYIPCSKCRTLLYLIYKESFNSIDIEAKEEGMLLHEGFRDSLESASEMMADCFPLVLTAIIISPDSREHHQ